MSHIANGSAESVGGNFFFPLWFGFWGNGGVSLEANQFQYDTTTPGGTPLSSNGSNFLVLVRVGLSYSFF